jgi:hypothetical protein
MLQPIAVRYTSWSEYVQFLFMRDIERRFCVNSPSALLELIDSIWRDIADISDQEHSWVSRNSFRKCEVCSEAGGLHFES